MSMGSVVDLPKTDVDDIEPRKATKKIRGQEIVILEMSAKHLNDFLRLKLTAETAAANAWMDAMKNAEEGSPLNEDALLLAVASEAIAPDELLKLALPESVHGVVPDLTASERKKIMEWILDVNEDLKRVQENFSNRLELTMLKKTLQAVPAEMVDALAKKMSDM